jgi:hypothetical protein
MFPEYISIILWPFAVKCYEDRLNNLVHRADGRTPYKTLACLDAAPFYYVQLSHFWLPVLCLGSSTAVRHWKDPQMGTLRVDDGYPCQVIAFSCI